MLDKEIVSVKNFKGIGLQVIDPIDGLALSYSRQGNTPLDYAFDSINLIYQKNGSIRSRDGFEDYIISTDLSANAFTVSGQVNGMWAINNLKGIDQVDRWLILTYTTAGNVGKLYDTGLPTASNPIASFVGMKYAFVINAFGRMYISPWEAWANPLGDASGADGGNNHIYLYDGVNMRYAGCDKPAVGTFAVTATAGGNVTPGLHLISVLFETDSGFKSAVPTAHLLTPLTVTNTTANATMSFTNIPVGAAGTGVIKRHIIVTKIVVNNNGQGLNGYEPFIAVTIDDNTTTSITFNKPDSALVDSVADYIANSSYIRSCVAMVPYGTRMVFLGSRKSGTDSSFKDTINVSNPNLPEQVYFPNGKVGESNTLIIGEGYVGNVMIGLEQNGVFYIFKDYSSHAIRSSSEDDPSTWPVDLVDAGKGAYPFGIASVGVNPSGIAAEGAFIAGRHGISYFNGRHSDYTLTDNMFEQFSFDFINVCKWSKLLVDPVRKLIFWTFGDPNSNIAYNCYTINYYEGIAPNNVKISKWSSPIRRINSISFTFDGMSLRIPGTYGTVTPATYFNTSYPLLTLVYSSHNPTGATNTVYIVSEALSQADFYFSNIGDLSKADNIQWQLETGFTPNDNGEIYQFSNLRIRAVNNGNSSISISNNSIIACSYNILDDAVVNGSANWINLPTQVVGLQPKKFLTIPINIQAEQVRFRFIGTGRVFIQQLILFGSKVGLDRPR